MISPLKGREEEVMIGVILNQWVTEHALNKEIF